MARWAEIFGFLRDAELSRGAGLRMAAGILVEYSVGRYVRRVAECTLMLDVCAW